MNSDLKHDLVAFRTGNICLDVNVQRPDPTLIRALVTNFGNWGDLGRSSRLMACARVTPVLSGPVSKWNWL
jgi:hypothetical protein